MKHSKTRDERIEEHINHLLQQGWTVEDYLTEVGKQNTLSIEDKVAALHLRSAK